MDACEVVVLLLLSVGRAAEGKSLVDVLLAKTLMSCTPCSYVGGLVLPLVRRNGGFLDYRVSTRLTGSTSMIEFFAVSRPFP